eukprot:7114766-Pyramimonas_sp.AAC.1
MVVVIWGSAPRGGHDGHFLHDVVRHPRVVLGAERVGEYARTTRGPLQPPEKGARGEEPPSGQVRVVQGHVRAPDFRAGTILR